MADLGRLDKQEATARKLGQECVEWCVPLGIGQFGYPQNERQSRIRRDLRQINFETRRNRGPSPQKSCDRPVQNKETMREPLTVRAIL